MGLADLQRALALLYSRSESRDEFNSDRDGFGRRHQLSSEDMHLLTRMTEGVWVEIAHSLQAKRRREVLSTLPNTHRALRGAAHSAFDLYWRTCRREAMSIHHDTVEFAAFLATSFDLPETSDWIRDLIRVESAPLEMALRKRCIKSIMTAHHPKQLVLATEGQAPISPPRCLTLNVFWRLTPDRSIRHCALSIQGGASSLKSRRC